MSKAIRELLECLFGSSSPSSPDSPLTKKAHRCRQPRVTQVQPQDQIAAPEITTPTRCPRTPDPANTPTGLEAIEAGTPEALQSLRSQQARLSCRRRRIDVDFYLRPDKTAEFEQLWELREVLLPPRRAATITTRSEGRDPRLNASLRVRPPLPLALSPHRIPGARRCRRRRRRSPCPPPAPKVRARSASATSTPAVRPRVCTVL